jgi:hypothetical protein
MHVIVAWIPMLGGDDRAAGEAASVQFPAAAQFWDGEKKLGAEVAHSIGADDWTAWDIYLFYPPGARWDDHLPAPAAALAQVKGVVVGTKGDVVGSQDDITGLLDRAADSFSRQCGCAMTTSSQSAPPGETSK